MKCTIFGRPAPCCTDSTPSAEANARPAFHKIFPLNIIANIHSQIETSGTVSQVAWNYLFFFPLPKSLPPTHSSFPSLETFKGSSLCFVRSKAGKKPQRFCKQFPNLPPTVLPRRRALALILSPTVVTTIRTSCGSSGVTNSSLRSVIWGGG